MHVIQEIGSYAGLAAVVGLAVLSALYFSQARDVKRLREWAGRAPERAPEPAGVQRTVATPASPAAARPVSSAVRPVPRAPGQTAAGTTGARPVPPAPAGARAAAAGAAPATAVGPAAATPAARAADATSVPGAGAEDEEKTEAAGGSANGDGTDDKPALSEDTVVHPPPKPPARDGSPAGDSTELDAADDWDDDEEDWDETGDHPAPERHWDDTGDDPALPPQPVRPGTPARPGPATPAAGAAAGAAGAAAAAGAAGAAGAKPATAGARPAATPGQPAGARPVTTVRPTGAPVAAGTGAGAPAKPSGGSILPPYEQSRPGGGGAAGGGGPRNIFASRGRGAAVLAAIAIVVALLAFGVTRLISNDGGKSSGTSKAPSGASAQPGSTSKKAPKQAGAIDPASVRVAVLNGTTVPGLAAQVGDSIQKQGFKLGTITNYNDQRRAESVVLYAPGAEREAAEVGRRLKISQREPIDPNSQGVAGDATVVVVAGQDKTQ